MADANEDKRVLVLQGDNKERKEYPVADMSPEAQNIYNKLVLVQNEVSKLNFDLEQKNIVQERYIADIQAMLTSKEEEAEDSATDEKQTEKSNAK
tara:strand:+ start:472 stop:756 length:285 start_codon:yes stop_codon:yes gene_type:complete